MGIVNVTVADSLGASATKSVSWQIDTGTGYPQPPDPTGWKTQVFESFRTATLDTTRWTARVGTLGAPREEYNRAENVKTGAGLDIVTKRESFGGRAITSGYISSQGKMEFPINSRVNIKATLPPIWNNAAGLWPALWFRWPGSGEADLMEAYGFPFLPARTASEIALARGSFQCTTHNDTMGSPARTLVVPTNLNPLIADGSSHIYGFEITDVGMTYYFDGVAIADVYKRPNPATWTQLANLAQGSINKSSFAGLGHVRIQTQVGSSYWGPSTATTALPCTFHVDYVHILNKV